MNRQRRQYLVKVAQDDFISRNKEEISAGVGLLGGAAAMQIVRSIGADAATGKYGRPFKVGMSPRLAAVGAASAIPLAAATYGGLTIWDKYKRRDM